MQQKTLISPSNENKFTFNAFGATCEWTFMCCSRLTAWPKLFLQTLQPNGLVPLWDLLTWTSSPWDVENTFCFLLIENDSYFQRACVSRHYWKPFFKCREKELQVGNSDLVTGNAVIHVGGWGVMCATVQGLLQLCAVADMVTIHAIGMLQHCGAEAQRVEIVGSRQGLPSVCRVVIGRKTCHVRLWGCTHQECVLESGLPSKKYPQKTCSSPFR